MGKIVTTSGNYPYIRYNSEDQNIQRLSRDKKSIVNIYKETDYLPNRIIDYLEQNPDKIFNMGTLLKKFKVTR